MGSSLRSKLTLLVLEQLSRMCWAVNWAVLEAKNANVPSQCWPIVDVRLNVVVGDALDTCDVISCLSSEGLEASGVSRDGEQVSKLMCCPPSTFFISLKLSWVAGGVLVYTR